MHAFGRSKISHAANSPFCTQAPTRCERMTSICCMQCWRRARDSNPRYPFRYASFQDWSHQPLGQLSAISKIPLSENQPHLCYGFSPSTPPGSRPAPLPALFASSSESVPVLSAGSTVPSESLTTSSRGSLFTKPSGGALPCAGCLLMSLPSTKLDAELRAAVQVAGNQSFGDQFSADNAHPPGV